MGICACPNPSLTEIEVKSSKMGKGESQNLPQDFYEKRDEELFHQQDRQIEEMKPTEVKKNPPTFKERFEENLPIFGEYAGRNELSDCISNLRGLLNAPNYAFLEEERNDRLHKMNPVKFKNSNIYDGQWNNQFQMEGQGEIFLFSENIYAKGIWRNGSFIKGRVHFSNGSYYEGDIEDSKFHGYGVLDFEDGSRYEGQFVRGERHGTGRLSFPDGSYYEGNFVNDCATGQGEFIWANQTKYKGNFNDLMLDGFGVMTNAQGSIYEGFFSKNQFQGKGKFIWSNGDNYDGDYQAGIKDGKGTFVNSNCTYSGPWRDNLPHGAGKVQQGSMTYTSYWRNGVCIETPEIIISASQLNADSIQPLNFTWCQEDINPTQLKWIQKANEEDKNQLKLSNIINYNPREQISYD